MSETNLVSTDTVQQNAEINTQQTVEERLSKDFGGETVKIEQPRTEVKTETPTTEVKQEPTQEETDALKTQAKELGLAETATKEEVDTALKAKAETEWQTTEVVKTPEEEKDGTWEGLIQELGLGDIPADYKEELGFETVQNMFKAKLESERALAQKESSYDRFTDVPETHRAEAELFVELMKTGQTPEQIITPLLEIKQAKGLDKEVLVRNFYENKLGGDSELVDLKMQQINEAGQLDAEHKLAMMTLNDIEKNILASQQQQVETFKNNQKQIQEQRTNKQNLELKIALDRVPEFLGKKLPDNLKSQLINELQTDAYRNMAGTAEQKIDYFLYNKFGKTAMKNFQDRALEKVVTEHKQNIHNVPTLKSGNANRIEVNDGTESVAERRLKEQGY